MLRTHLVRVADVMAFAGSTEVHDQLLENSLPRVGALAVGAPIDDDVIQAAIRRSQIVASETVHRATVTEAAKAEVEKHELLNMKLNQNGVYKCVGASLDPQSLTTAFLRFSGYRRHRGARCGAGLGLSYAGGAAGGYSSLGGTRRRAGDFRRSLAESERACAC